MYAAAKNYNKEQLQSCIRQNKKKLIHYMSFEFYKIFTFEEEGCMGWFGLLQALELCVDHNISLTEEMAERMSIPKVSFILWKINEIDSRDSLNIIY
jgi:hypothetical protein